MLVAAVAAQVRTDQSKAQGVLVAAVMAAPESAELPFLRPLAQPTPEAEVAVAVNATPPSRTVPLAARVL